MPAVQESAWGVHTLILASRWPSNLSISISMSNLQGACRCEAFGLSTWLQQFACCNGCIICRISALHVARMAHNIDDRPGAAGMLQTPLVPSRIPRCMSSPIHAAASCSRAAERRTYVTRTLRAEAMMVWGATRPAPLRDIQSMSST